MKIIFLIIGICICKISPCQKVKEFSFNYKIFYEFNFQTDSNNINSKKTANAILLWNIANGSVYEDLNRFHMESDEYQQYKNNNNTYKINVVSAMAYPISFFTQVFRERNAYFVYERNANAQFVYEENTLPTWNIMEDTIRLDSFLCVKAITNFGGRKWTAWFTNDIPIPSGPHLFVGLPGLIFRLYDEDKYFSWTLKNVIEISGIHKYLDLNETYFTRTTKKEFINYRNTFHFWDASTGGIKRVKPLTNEEKSIWMKNQLNQFHLNNNYIER